jgi:hypothetical protein
MPHPRRTLRRLWSEQARQVIESWSRRSGLNGRPAVYETAALPTELRRPAYGHQQLTLLDPEGSRVFLSAERGQTSLSRACPVVPVL